MFRQIKWLFFDVGSTLVDESKANEHRLLDAIAGTDTSYGDAYARAVQLAGQNIAHPLKHLGLPVPLAQRGRGRISASSGVSCHASHKI